MHISVILLVLAALALFAQASIAYDGREVKPSATKGMVIDAGSGGSRMHVYTWQPRRFSTVPPPLSYPEGNEQWTSRTIPGIDMFTDDLDGIADHLSPLIDFAKRTLIDFKGQYADFPIYFYATGGLREVEQSKRDLVIAKVRELLSDKENNPFFFKQNFARIISGEEEAIFSWAATNFLMGTLLPASHGTGIVSNVNDTYGTVDLGGASTQIAYYIPTQDILEGLYKFQLGSQKQWNVYTKSHLQFGINSARIRHMSSMVDGFFAKGSRGWHLPHIPNSCLHSGYSERVTSTLNDTLVAEVAGPELPQADQLENCMALLRPLMRLKLNSFCDNVYHGDCSIAGQYQPPLPGGEHGRFIGTSSMVLPWNFLQLPPTATLEMLRQRTSAICQMNFDDILFYSATNSLRDLGSAESLPYFCFMGSYILVLLKDGYKFQDAQTLTVMEQVHGNRMGWALGAILYEINELPWEMKRTLLQTYPGLMVLLALVVGFVLGGAVYALCGERGEAKQVRALIQGVDQLVRPSTNGTYTNGTGTGAGGAGGAGISGPHRHYQAPPLHTHAHALHSYQSEESTGLAMGGMVSIPVGDSRDKYQGIARTTPIRGSTGSAAEYKPILKHTSKYDSN